MPKTNKYTFVITNETGEGASAIKQAIAQISASSSNGTPDTTGGDKTGSGSDIFGKVYKSIVVREVVQVAKSELMYKANTVELRTGAKDLQQKVDLQIQLGNAGLSMLGATVAGFIAGGAVGALAGAGLSLLSQTISTVQSISQAQRTIDLKQSIENQSIASQMVRAGSRGSRGGYND